MAVLRDLADYGATLCFDEAEKLEHKNADPEKLALLLSGNRRGSTMAVKELDGEKHWVTRHVSTYCPRLFSAIRLPGETLESRSIIVPLVRSADKVKANSEVLNPKHWPHPRPALIDDLWALTLAHLAHLPSYEDAVNDEASLGGRLLEPWRPILSVAKWLQDQGVEGLYERMHNLAITYQTEKKEIVRDDFASIVIEALHNLHNIHNLYGEGCTFTIKIKDIVEKILSFYESSEDETEDDETKEKSARSLSTKVGTTLRQLRFSRKGQVKRGETVQWLVSCDVLQKCIISHGLLHLFPKEGYEGYAHQTSPENSPAETSPQNFTTQPSDPQDPGYEGYGGYEVMQDNESEHLRESKEAMEREPGCDDA
jgi:hypothetical protein